MVKGLKNIKEEIEMYSAMIMHSVTDLIKNNYNKTTQITFEFIENRLFLFKDTDNKSILNKREIDIDYDYLKELYLNLYNRFKENYLNSEEISIDVFEIFDLKVSQDSFLILNVRDIRHRNIITIKLQNYGKERECLDQIKEDWIKLTSNLQEEKKRIK